MSSRSIHGTVGQYGPSIYLSQIAVEEKNAAFPAFLPVLRLRHSLACSLGTNPSPDVVPPPYTNDVPRPEQCPSVLPPARTRSFFFFFFFLCWAGRRERDGSLAPACGVDNRDSVVLTGAVPVLGVPSSHLAGQTPARPSMAGLVRVAPGFGERRFLFGGGGGDGLVLAPDGRMQ